MTSLANKPFQTSARLLNIGGVERLESSGHDAAHDALAEEKHRTNPNVINALKWARFRG
jgi:hypothetical protein